MTRVLLSLDKLRERNSGLERFSLHLARALGEAAAADVDLVFMAPRRRWPDLGGTGARLEPPRFFNKSRVQSAVCRIVPAGMRSWGRPRYDVWHALAQDAKFLPLDPRIRLVLTLHDLTVRRIESGKKLARAMKRFQANVDRASVVVTGSHFAAEEIREHLRLGDRPVEVIYHGITLDPAAPGRKPAGLGEGPFLVALGRVVRTKNLHTLVDMMTLVPDRNLLIVGDDSDPHAAELRNRVADAGLNDRVRVLGPVGDPERVWLFHHADALLQPSLAEGFGLPVLEAMACGTPVFLARRTSLPEVGGELAFYWDTFEPDAMATVFHRGMTVVAADPTYPDRLVAHAATFSWAAAAKGYLDIYRSLAGVSSPPVGAG